jgi:site-specific recombinase XerD
MRQDSPEVVFRLPYRGGLTTAGSIRSAFESAVKDAKLSSGFHFHDCRHHFASWFVMRGGNLPALQAILGHATLAMTMRYSHLAPEHLRSEVAKTERGAQSVSEITHEVVSAGEASQKSLK